LRLEVQPGEACNGLAIYGETLGCYPVAPMIVVEGET
jgi:hypothetical protein